MSKKTILKRAVKTFKALLSIVRIDSFEFWKHVTLHLVPFIMLSFFIVMIVMGPPVESLLRIASNYTRLYMPTLQASALIFFGLLSSICIRYMERVKNHHSNKTDTNGKNPSLNLLCYQSCALIASFVLSLPIWIINAIYDPIINIRNSSHVFKYLVLSFSMLTMQLWVIVSLIGLFLMHVIMMVESPSAPRSE